MKLLVLSSLVILLSSCAAMKRDFQENNCNYEGAYQLGTNDANNAKDMNTRQFSICSPASKKEAQKGYREGYVTVGDQNTPSSFNSLLKRVIGKSNNKYKCSGELFSRTYSGKGETKREAILAAKAKCEKSSDSIHCHSSDFNKCERL